MEDTREEHSIRVTTSRTHRSTRPPNKMGGETRSEDIEEEGRAEALGLHCFLSRPGRPTAPRRQHRFRRRRLLRSSPRPSEPVLAREITPPDHGIAAGELPPLLLPSSADRRRRRQLPMLPPAAAPPPMSRAETRERETKWRGAF